MAIRQSVCIPILPAMDPDHLLRELAAIGYAAIEIWSRESDFETLCETAVRHGLQMASMLGHDSLGDGLNKRENHDRIEAELKTSIDIAAQHGMRGLICFSGNRIDGMSDDEAAANTATVLGRVAPYAEANSVNLNLELLNSKVDHIGYQCDHSAWGLQVIEQVNSPNVKLLYDIYHMQIMEGDVIRTVTNHIESIGHLHTAGNPGRNDLDDDQELNYRGICRAINATTYDGFVGHELIPKGDVLSALRQAFEVCDA
jgi:hydroxypyruvate isomerase